MNSRCVVGSTCFAAALTLSLAVPRAAHAQERGFEAGLRSGYGLALGKYSENDNLADIIRGVVPIWVDAGFRIDANWFVGAYFQYGLGITGDEIDEGCGRDGFDCSTRDLRAGAQIQYHILPRGSLDPWLGYGFGYEWLTLSQTVKGANIGGQPVNAEADLTVRGFEFANFMAGLDFRPSDHFYVGPFVSFSLGQYSKVSVSCESNVEDVCGRSSSGDIDSDSRKLHQWLLLGVRGGYTMFGG